MLDVRPPPIPKSRMRAGWWPWGWWQRGWRQRQHDGTQKRKECYFCHSLGGHEALREGFSSRNPEFQGWGRQPDEDWRGLDASPADCSPDIHQLKAQEADGSRFPACRGTQLGGLSGQGLRKGGKLGVLTGFFYFYNKTLCLKFLQRTNSMGFR